MNASLSFRMLARGSAPGLFLAAALLSLAPAQAQTAPSDSALVRSIFDEVLAHGEAHENLRVLCKDIGHRLSGSPSADRAIEWGRQVLQACGADTAYVMPVTVPSWTRGDVAEARATLPGQEAQELRITALGGSVATPGEDWLEGPLLVVKHLDALDTLDAAGFTKFS